MGITSLFNPPPPPPPPFSPLFFLSFLLFFRRYSCEAYNILRHSANLILNLFSMMEDSSIPALNDKKAVVKITEKFRLHLDDEQAANVLQSLINDSVSALFPQIRETFHRFAQYMR